MLRGFMRYISTRGQGPSQSFKDILMTGLSPDGGLYVPETWPQLDMAALKGKSYVEIAEAVIGPFVAPDINPADLRKILEDTYGTASKVFETAPDTTPIVWLDGQNGVMELFHGPTLAFKDVALQFLGRLFDHVLGQGGEHLTIIGATSGDTGSAAIEACRDRDNITVFILHPHNRTSEVQRRQMTTVLAENIHNIALEGTFDDCQSMVKILFNDAEMKSKLKISAINSINWARIIAQTVYYVYACVNHGPLSFAVPTGNFGNIYAAYVAQKMGAPVKRLIIGSNRNDILTRFFETGEMRQETVVPSHSPSMDIQISSNFERFLFDLLDRDASAVKSVMEKFTQTGVYDLPPEKLEAARRIFQAYRCDDAQTIETIRSVYKTKNMIVDPHTAVGMYAMEQFRGDGRLTEHEKSKEPIICLACAHPAKFPAVGTQAIGQPVDLPESLSDLHQRPERYQVLANKISEVKQHIISKSKT